MNIGYGQRTILPDLSKPVFLAGFGRDRRASKIHDDLSARAIAIEWGSKRLVLAVVDLIGLGRVVCQRIAAQVPGCRLVVAATHTHHAPDTIGLWGPTKEISGLDTDYLGMVEQAVVEAAQEALQTLRLARLRASNKHEAGVVKNVRDPEIVDDELTTLQFTDAKNDRPLVNLTIFPCHPETLFDQNTVITADYPHYLRKFMEKESGAPCIFFAGALGGMMTPDVREHSFVEAEEIGALLSITGLRAVVNCPVEDPQGINFRRVEYRTPLDSPLLEGALQFGLVQVKMNESQQIMTETSLLRLGSAWLAFVPGELLPALGLRMKEEMRQAGARTAAVIGLANDELGYILPDDAYVYPTNPFEPGEHYEETMSTGPTAGSDLLHAFEQLISKEHPDE